MPGIRFLVDAVWPPCQHAIEHPGLLHMLLARSQYLGFGLVGFSSSLSKAQRCWILQLFVLLGNKLVCAHQICSPRETLPLHIMTWTLFARLYSLRPVIGHHPRRPRVLSPLYNVRMGQSRQMHVLQRCRVARHSGSCDAARRFTSHATLSCEGIVPSEADRLRSSVSSPGSAKPRLCFVQGQNACR